MRRLYIQIYFVLLAVLLLFALLMAGVAWHLDKESDAQNWAAEITALADAIVPPKDAPPERLESWARAIAAPFDLDITILGQDRALLLQIGDAMPPVPAGHQTGWIREKRRHRSVGAIGLSDGRWVLLRGDDSHQRRPLIPLLAAISMLAVAIGIAAHPLTRRLTRRLETLKDRVDALGEGRLDARVPVEGHDEIAELARSFNGTADRIAALVEDKTRLLAHTSHELRTPLARIRVALELLREEPRPELIERIDRDVEELDELIGELLVASRMDAPEKTLVTEPVDLLAVAAEEATRLGEIEVGGSAAIVEGDPRLLRRLVRNLLQNAIRHGERPIRVHVRPVETPLRLPAESTGAVAASTVELLVDDCGAGIPENERERIFEPFYRREGEGGAEGGIGLGLALVRQIALHHGGQIACTPATGDGDEPVGTRFVLTLPGAAT